MIRVTLYVNSHTKFALSPLARKKAEMKRTATDSPGASVPDEIATTGRTKSPSTPLYSYWVNPILSSKHKWGIGKFSKLTHALMHSCTHPLQW